MKRLTMSDINAYLDGALSDEEKREVASTCRSFTAFMTAS
jgi:hypothetical protein